MLNSSSGLRGKVEIKGTSSANKAGLGLLELHQPNRRFDDGWALFVGEMLQFNLLLARWLIVGSSKQKSGDGPMTFTM
jgi:hypothetical protein